MALHLRNVHPGEVLQHEFLAPAGISVRQLARMTGMPVCVLESLIDGKMPVNVDTAIALGAALGMRARFWLGLQIDFDLEEAQREVRAAGVEVVMNEQ